MSIRRYRPMINLLNDDFAFFDSFFSPSQSYTFKGEIYDPEKYDLVPKKEYTEKKVKEIEQEIADVEDYYKERLAKLKEKREELLRQK